MWLLFLFCSISLWAQQNDMMITTSSIGPFKLGMNKAAVERIVPNKLTIPTEQNDYNHHTLVKYNKETLEIGISEPFEGDGVNSLQIISVSVQSPLFQTSKGIKVGSTKEELLEVYKDYPNFELYPEWLEEESYSKTASSFIINDDDNATSLIFSIKNSRIIKITVLKTEAGC